MENEINSENSAFDSESVFDVEPEMSDPSEDYKPLDCARFLAWFMVNAAMGRSRKPLLPGIYIFQAPNDDWRSAIGKATRDIHLTSKPGGGSKRRAASSGRPALRIVDLPANADLHKIEQAVSEVQSILERDETAIVVASNPKVIPKALRRASDKIFVVPLPRRQWFAALIRELFPDVHRIHFNGLKCEAVTPGMLCLAQRRNTTAPAFVKRIMALTAPLSSSEPGAAKVVPLQRLHGVDDAKKWAQDLKTDLERYRAGHIAWSELSRGLLLSGAPGTAKTTLAASIAEFCDLAFISTSYAEWQRRGGGHLGDVLKGIAATFAEARSRKPALLFIDELDTVGSRRREGKWEEWWRAIINALLPELDGTTDNEGLIFMAASNHPNLIDPALLRSGRLEEHINLSLPDAEALVKIYVDELESEAEENINLNEIGGVSLGMTGADVVKTCKTARRRARSADRLVNFDDLLAAISGDQFSPDAEKLYRIAVHEVGHAIIASILPELCLEHVSVVGRGDTLGGTAMGMRSDKPMTLSSLEAYVTAILGGRAAEQVVFGEVTAGAGGRDGSDLSRATQLAAQAELSLGLHKNGLIWYEPQSTEQLAKLFALRPDLELAVRVRLDHAYCVAVQLIQAKAPLVQRVAEQLVLRKVMTGAEIATLVRDASFSDELAPVERHPPFQAIAFSRT